MSNCQNIVNKLLCILPKKGFIPLHEPVFSGNEEKYVSDCIKTGWVSSAGSYVDRFEKSLAAYTDAKYAVAVVNGTAALHLCYKIIGVKRDDEILIPTLTFVATANAAKYVGAIPHFIDVNERDFGVDPAKLKKYLDKISEVKNGFCYNKFTSRKIAALTILHCFGHPAKLDEILEVADAFNIPVIEDAAESLGSFYKNKHVGNYGRVSALSFNGNKIITTGGGGAIITNDENMAKKAKHLSTTAKAPSGFRQSHDMVGYNYRMPNINAALGCAQLEQINYFLKQKRKLAQQYYDIFQDDKIRFVTESEDCLSNYWLNTLVLDQYNILDNLIKVANDHNIMIRPFWKLMHKLDMFKNCPKMDLSVAEDLARKTINIPSSANLVNAAKPLRATSYRISQKIGVNTH